MTLSIRMFLPAGALAVVALAMTVPASAQDGAIRVLVGFGPGSTSDAVARLLADRMKASLGNPVLVDNRPGANGFIAAEALKNARGDGKTLMIAPIGVTVFAPLTHANLRFDPLKDFAPVSLAANFQFALAVGPAAPAKTLPEHIAWIRANPAQASYGLPLAGGPGHFLGVMVARETGVNLTFVTYKGGGPLVTDLIGGQVPAGIALVSDMIKQHQAKRLTMLAVFGPERSHAVPEVPTFKESGMGNIGGGLGWHAFYTTAGTARPTIDRLSGAIAAAVKAPEVSERLVALGLEPVGSTPDELARRIAEDVAIWGPAIKASGFRADE